ncbi:MAG: hypothetical protein AB8H03_04000 [Saprospiraceae bacterium]
MKTIPTFIFLIISFAAIGQILPIKKEDKTVSFKENNFFIFSLSKPDDLQNWIPTVQTTLAGFIIDEFQDSIQFEITNFNQFTNSHLVKPAEFIKLTNNPNQIKFAKQDVNSFDVYKSEKNYCRKENFLMIGGVITLTGIVTAANFFMFKKSENRKKLLISGGIQFGVGLSFIIFSNSYKDYDMRSGKPKWNFNNN